MKQILFSRHFPVTHPNIGESTFFVEKIWKSLTTTMGYSEPEYFKDELNFESVFDHEVYLATEPKHHTIRAGIRWKEGEYFAPKVWSGKPYCSKCIQVAPPLQIKKLYNFQVIFNSSEDFNFYLNGRLITDRYEIQTIAQNDGLTVREFFDWFGLKKGAKPFHFAGQIICFSNAIQY